MEEENNVMWEAPPPPDAPVIEEEPPQMSEAAALGNVFIEPGNTFEDLRRKPRFIYGMLIMIVLITTYTFLFTSHLGEERMKRVMIDQMEKNPQVQSLPAEQKEKQIQLGMTISNYARYAIPLFVIVGMLIGALIYWMAAKVFGGTLGFGHALSVWVYSSFPPTVIAMLANIIVLFLKDPDNIDIATSQRGVLQASLGFLVDGKAHPVLGTLLNTFDFFQIWGWILAAIGLQKVAKISKGNAWAVVLIVALISIAYRILSSVLSGNPM